MGGEVLDDADVANAVGERALTAASTTWKIVAQLAGGEPGLEGANGGVAPLDVTDAGDDARPLERLDEPGARRHVGGQRLLDEGVHARRRELQADRLVVVGRGRRRPRQSRPSAMSASSVRHTGVPCATPFGSPEGVGNSDEVDAVEVAQHPDVVAAHHPQSDHADPHERSRQHPFDDVVDVLPASRCGPTGSDSTSDGGTLGLGQVELAVPIRRAGGERASGSTRVRRRRVRRGELARRSRSGDRTVYWW